MINKKRRKHVLTRTHIHVLFITILTPHYILTHTAELIIITTKMLMTGALSVVEPGSPIQLVLATLVMLAFTLITLKLAPYRHKSDDWTTFLVSLVITGNTQAGFVLLMDKDNSPHNFNPKNIEALLLFMNITVLVLQALNMILIKCGWWDMLMKKPCCRKIQRACRVNNSGAAAADGVGATSVVPISNKTRDTATRLHQQQQAASTENPDEENTDQTVDRLLAQYSNAEDGLKKKNDIRRQRRSINVQHRVAARRKVRQTKALTKAAAFSGISADATETVLSAMDYERYEKGAIICEEGAVADRFFIIVAGQCEATLGAGAQSVHVGNLKALDIMGENALLVDEGEEGDATSHVRSATITVVSDVVQTLELHRFEFERLVEMGTIGQEVLQRVRALQADRREIREALHPPPEEQQAIGDDEGDTDGGTARLVVSPPSPPPPEGKRED